MSKAETARSAGSPESAATTRIPGPSTSSRTYTPVHTTEVSQGQEAIRNATSILRARKMRIARWEASGPENMTSPGQTRLGTVHFSFLGDGSPRNALRSLGTGEVESRQYRFQNEVRRQRKAMKNVEEVEITERYITVDVRLTFLHTHVETYLLTE